MKSFFKHAGEFLLKYPQISINSTDEMLVRDECMKHLGITNVRQLNDRYEGQAFLNKTLKNVGSVMVIQRYLGIPVINVRKTDLGDFKPKLVINNKEFTVLVFQFGTLPLVDIDNLSENTFFIIQKDRVTFNLCGFAKREIINENVIAVSFEI